MEQCWPIGWVEHTQPLDVGVEDHGTKSHCHRGDQRHQHRNTKAYYIATACTGDPLSLHHSGACIDHPGSMMNNNRKFRIRVKSKHHDLVFSDAFGQCICIVVVKA